MVLSVVSYGDKIFNIFCHSQFPFNPGIINNLNHFVSDI